jgi:hypothetical protein
MPLSSRWLSLGVGGELEEHLLESAAVGVAELGEHHAAVVRRAPDHRGFRVGAQRSVLGHGRGDAGRGQCPLQGLDVGGTDDGAGGGEELCLRALGDDPALPDHHDVVGDDLDLGQQVGGEQHGPPVVGVVAEQVAHPADAGRVEPVGGLVQDQHRRVADQGGRDAEALAHAERVVAHPTVRLGPGEADQLEQLGHPGCRDAHDLLGDGQDLAAGAAGVLGGGVEHHADLAPGVGQVGEPAAGDGRRALGRGRQTDHHPHGRGLSGPVRAEEAGDPTRAGREVDVVDDGVAAVLLGQ